MDKEGCKLDEKPPSYDEFSTTYFARPTMHNCVGGGDLEYDLDVALILSKDWVATKNLHDRLSLKDKAKDVPDLPQIDIVNLHVDKNRDSAGELSPTIQFASSSISTSSWKSASRLRQNIPKNSRDSQRPKTCSAPFGYRDLQVVKSASCKHDSNREPSIPPECLLCLKQIRIKRREFPTRDLFPFNILQSRNRHD
jgi:hypothetical protein